MKHINDTQMLDMLGGYVQADEQESLLAHLARCSNCRQRWNELRQTWDYLGECEIDTSGLDLLPNLTSAIQHRSRHINFLSIQGLTRIAASILLAAVIGYVAGRFSTRKSDLGCLCAEVFPGQSRSRRQGSCDVDAGRSHRLCLPVF